uniref:Uncharacterized protein LOC113796533 isoform X2 n=1 Tax=Dermatophagoides pteronyssinus TaxID=6956 RepID=A0A6P6YBG9_DERPT|nr:uncharacterized protein LOC113796533 isoform X2 [Dermatophagoides pteronyssinus]
MDTDSQRLFSHLLLMMMFVVVNVWMVNGDDSLIVFDMNDDQIEFDTVRFAYKSVYGLPKSLQCSESVYHQFNECEKSSHREWKVTIDEYFYETKQFCCFIWCAMACELTVAAKCNQNYSQQIETNTRKLFTSVCDKISSTQDSWNCWWTEERQINAAKVLGIIILSVLFISIVVGAFFGCRKYLANAKLKKIAKQIENPTEVIIDFEKNKSSSKLKPISIPTPTPTPSTRSSISSETGSQSGEQSLLDNVLENLMKENGIIDRVFNYFHVDNVIS